MAILKPTANIEEGDIVLNRGMVNAIHPSDGAFVLVEFASQEWSLTGKAVPSIQLVRWHLQEDVWVDE